MTNKHTPTNYSKRFWLVAEKKVRRSRDLNRSLSNKWSLYLDELSNNLIAFTSILTWFLTICFLSEPKATENSDDRKNKASGFFSREITLIFVDIFKS